MNESMLLQALGQVSASEASEVFQTHLRGCVLQMISQVMAAEVSELCGPKHRPSESDCFRSGSSSGRALVNGQCEEIIRPRVRSHDEEGRSIDRLYEGYGSDKVSAVQSPTVIWPRSTTEQAASYPQ